MVVQHNLRAMNSNRMLGLTANVQSKSTEKLSSGYKINRAADDAAGLSISEKMRKQIRGLSQASLNAADGISAVQTAEGALNEVQDMLQRMNELAVKASNGTMSTDDRSYIQDEIDQLITEIDRVSETTKFNETYLLRGDKNATAGTNFAYNETDVISQDLYYVEDGAVKTLAKGTLLTAVDSDVTYYSDNDGAVAGVKINLSDSATYVESKIVVSDANKYYEKVNGSFVPVDKGTIYDSTKDVYYTTSNTSGAAISSDFTEVATSVMSANVTTEWLVRDGQTVYDTKTGDVLDAGYSIGSAASTISNYYEEKTTVALDVRDTVAYNANVAKDTVQLVDKDGNEVAANGLDRYLDSDGTLKAGVELYLQTGEGVSGLTAVTQDQIDELVNSSNKHDVGALSLKLHVGADATANNQITLDIYAMSAKAIGIEGIRVDGADDSNALDAIEVIKEALNKVSDQRSALGAVQNRLEHTIANLDNVVENTTAAESQIRDTDMATEMVKYSNNNILAQAGQAMLAQANQANQGVLSILG